MDCIEFQLRSVDGSLHVTKCAQEVVDLISRNSKYEKVSYSDENGNDFRWERITDNDNKLHNQSIWANRPMSFLVDIACKISQSHVESHSQINKIFVQKCTEKWPHISHDRFCKLLANL